MHLYVPCAIRDTGWKYIERRRTFFAHRKGLTFMFLVARLQAPPFRARFDDVMVPPAVALHVPPVYAGVAPATRNIPDVGPAEVQGVRVVGG